MKAMSKANKYDINGEVWIVVGMNKAIQVRVRNVIVREIGNEVSEFIGWNTAADDISVITGYRTTDKFIYDRTEVTYDLSNDLTNIPEESIFLSKEELLSSL